MSDEACTQVLSIRHAACAPAIAAPLVAITLSGPRKPRRTRGDELHAKVVRAHGPICCRGRGGAVAASPEQFSRRIDPRSPLSPNGADRCPGELLPPFLDGRRRLAMSMRGALMACSNHARFPGGQRWTGSRRSFRTARPKLSRSTMRRAGPTVTVRGRRCACRPLFAGCRYSSATSPRDGRSRRPRPGRSCAERAAVAKNARANPSSRPRSAFPADAPPKRSDRPR